VLQLILNILCLCNFYHWSQHFHILSFMGLILTVFSIFVACLTWPSIRDIFELCHSKIRNKLHLEKYIDIKSHMKNVIIFHLSPVYTMKPIVFYFLTHFTYSRVSKTIILETSLVRGLHCYKSDPVAWIKCGQHRNMLSSFPGGQSAT
jgi:hypothetical protein